MTASPEPKSPENIQENGAIQGATEPPSTDNDNAVAETAEVVAPTNPRANLVNDNRFIQDLEHLKDLRSFLLQEAVIPKYPNGEPLSFGELNLLRYSETGRSPSRDEWNDLENLTEALFSSTTADLRRKFRMGDIPKLIWIAPLVLILATLVSLVGGIATFEYFDKLNDVSYFATIMGVLYVVYLMSLGAMGAVAFIGMNALSVQSDVTFDLSNKRLAFLRIVLGALFGLILTIPFGFTGFTLFARSALGEAQDVAFDSKTLLLLLPFVLGFSTSLVILVLNRMVEAVQSFFGKPANSADSPKPSATNAPTLANAQNR